MSVLSATPPRFTLDEAARIARDVFGVDGEARPLPSERDQNFTVGAWVLKVANSGEERAVLELENAAVAHVARVDPALPVAEPHGGVHEVEGHLVRLVPFLPGATLAPHELDERRLRELGATLGRLVRALRGFFHPAAGRVLQWDVKRFAGLRPLLPHLDDPETLALVERALERWERDVAPRLPELRAQVVHGDLSLDNALFAADGTVSGIVDFGDCCHTVLPADLAATLASVMAGSADPAATAATLLDAYETVTALEPLERELLPRFVEARLATSLVIAAWRLGLYPENAAYITVDSERFRALLAQLDAEQVDLAGTAALLERRARVFGPLLQRLTYRRPIHMVRAEGVWMVDAEGRRYLDAYNNVPVVGHSHPRVVEAVARQSRLLNTNMRYLHGAAIELAERLLATMPPEIDTCLLVNSGSEANELAWRIATTVTGHGGAVVTEHAYHGVTAATAALSPEEWGAQPPPAHVRRIPPAGDPADLDAAAGGLELAAVFLDACFTSDGIHTAPPEYHRGLVERTHAHGGLFVADEVQGGHGRTGEHLWSFAPGGVVPDLVTLGKPMGNGYPIAAVLLRSELAAAMAERTTVFSTFGGNPVACAAALAVLDVLEEERLVERAAEVCAHLRGRLARLDVVEVRGRGLMIGVELGDGARAERVVNELRERGVLVGRAGKTDSALKIRPPLVFEREHADLLLERLAEALARL